jgi:two-component system alkaline phosphatase synthesis response regulator PhoP
MHCEVISSKIRSRFHMWQIIVDSLDTLFARKIMTPQIIVCDDEPHIIRAISLKFTRAGFDVKGATDVDSCWRMLHRNDPPALLIVDDSMSRGPGGLELVRRVRADAELADLPIVLLTAESFDLYEYKEQLADFEIAQVVTKPFSPRELLATVCCLLDYESMPLESGAGHHFNMSSVGQVV